MSGEKEFGSPAETRTQRQNIIEVLNLSQIRVSTAGFIAIQDAQGRQLLIINQERFLRGEKKMLNPIGGSIEATAQGAAQVKRMLGIERFESERSPNDLRFVSPGAKLNEYREWFLSHQGRETDPKREAVEELCQEQLGEQQPPLLEQDLEGLRTEKPRYATELAKTRKTGKEGVLTLRLLELTPVTIPETAMNKLVAKAAKPESLIRFVTAQEIVTGKTINGEVIGTTSKCLIVNDVTIPAFE